MQRLRGGEGEKERRPKRVNTFPFGTVGEGDGGR